MVAVHKEGLDLKVIHPGEAISFQGGLRLYVAKTWCCRKSTAFGVR